MLPVSTIVARRGRRCSLPSSDLFRSDSTPARLSERSPIRKGRRSRALRVRRLHHLILGRTLHSAALRARARLRSADNGAVLHGLLAGLAQAAQFFWDSLFGLVFGFLISAIAQVMLTPATMERYLGPGAQRHPLRGRIRHNLVGLFVWSGGGGARILPVRRRPRRSLQLSHCFDEHESCDPHLFWSLLGWQFAFAEFFGGIIIIAVVTIGLTLCS